MKNKAHRLIQYQVLEAPISESRRNQSVLAAVRDKTLL